MERRKAITAAAAVSLTMLAGGAGIALNSNIVGAGANDDVGKLSPVGPTTSAPATIYVDPSTTAPSTFVAPPVQPSEARPTTTSAPSSYRGDDHEDDDHEHESDEDHEYEGHDDDD